MNNQEPASPVGGQPTTPQEPVVSQQPQPKPKLLNWASILIIVVAAVVVVGLVAWGGYELFKPAPPEETGEEETEEDEFADWQIYQNEEYGYEVKHPKDWKLITPSANWIAFDRPNKTYSGPDAPTYDFNVKISKTTISDLNQWAIQEAGGQEVITDSKNITVDGISAKRIEYFGFYSWYLAVGLIKDGNLYKFSTVNKDIISTFNQILSTFKFLEKEMGYIKKVYEKSGKRYLDIDYVQYLTGNEAIEAMREDGKCPSDIYPNPNQCIPNGYYIRNQNPKIRTFEISENVKIIRTSAFNYDGSGVKEITYEEFKNIFDSGSYLKDLLYNIEVKDNKIIKISEQFIP